MATPTPEPDAKAKALLDAANRASEKVAALHIAFLAVCAYIVVIVFGTTDMNLLIGKGIKLPVVAVDVPIVGFYAAAPYLLVLIHFNLLLQLQLLSQKLYAFDAAAPENEGVGGLRDQLNIFPYNYYLVGQRSPLVKFFVALLVTITMLLLPLGALLTLQARFLAYQSEVVTWAQRVAIWLDVGVVTVFWPVILDRKDSWSTFMRSVWDNVKQRPLTWTWRFAGIALAVSWLASTSPPLLTSTVTVSWRPGAHPLIPMGLIPSSKDFEKIERVDRYLWFLAFTAWLLFTLCAHASRHGLRWLSRGHYFTASQTNHLVPGATGLLVVLLLGLLLPVLFLVDGERFDLPNTVGTQVLNYLGLRCLDLQEAVLLAKPARPETIADLHSTEPAKREAALRSIERINLQWRSLRGAHLSSALIPNADLQYAQLQGAFLTSAQLQGANLLHAQLQGAFLTFTQLQGANLFSAQLQGAFLLLTQLQGANLSSAQLQGATLQEARLQGATLQEANLQGAFLRFTRLQGANLRAANLQAADLFNAVLQAADLRDALLYTNLLPSNTKLVEARGLKWQPLGAEEVEQLKKVADNWSSGRQDEFLKRLDDAKAAANLKPPTFESCLRNGKTEVKCKTTYDLGEFREKLSDELVALACQSSDVAVGIVRRISSSSYDLWPTSSLATTTGLASHLQDIRKEAAAKESCPGLFALTADDAAQLARLAQEEKR